MGFWPRNWSKWPSQRAKICPKILILEVIYQPFELKMGLLKPKIMPKHFLNIFKTTLKKSKKRLFWPQKLSNHGYQFWQKWPKFHQKISILVVIRNIFGSILHTSMGRSMKKLNFDRFWNFGQKCSKFATNIT